jgi:hypothetical protein
VEAVARSGRLATTADIFVILIAVLLPGSTSLVAIFAAAMLVSMAPFHSVRLDSRAFLSVEHLASLIERSFSGGQEI